MRYKLFGRTGLRVSELCLGTMSFGTEWNWGTDYATSKAAFDAFAEAGGNFVDTANRYTEGTSERWLGEFIAQDRDHFVVATKYTLKDRSGDPNFAGNHRKNLMRSLKTSLERMKTDFVDILWVHMWDFQSPVDEVMRALDDVVRAGLVQYVAISDTPAWIISQANTMADFRGWTPFAGLQIEYSLLQRTPERDLLPMAAQFGLTLTPWGVLGGGALSGKYLRGEQGRLPEQSIRRNERNSRIAETVLRVAERYGTTGTQVALAWARARGEELGVGVVPIIGAKTAAYVHDAVSALSLSLSADDMAELNTVSAIELGFPHEFLQQETVRDYVFAGTFDQIDRRK